jgi:adenylate kinase family enzyme
MRRVVVGGSTGSGKTTFSRELALRMGVPVIELDALHWGPGWTEEPPPAFRARIAKAVEADAWVVDGNYSVARDLTWGRADTLVWLDYRLAVVLWRLFKRTNRRIWSREELWNGNRERFSDAYLSRESLYLWLVSSGRTGGAGATGRSSWPRRRDGI